MKNKTNYLGTAETIGQLKKIIKNYPDDTSFGFRNQSIQGLFEVNLIDEKFIVFQRIDKAKQQLK